MQATPKQISYILSMQSKLGMSNKYVDVKGILGRNPIGFQLTKAVASEFIEKLQSKLERAAK